MRDTGRVTVRVWAVLAAAACRWPWAAGSGTSLEEARLGGLTRVEVPYNRAGEIVSSVPSRGPSLALGRTRMHGGCTIMRHSGIRGSRRRWAAGKIRVTARMIQVTNPTGPAHSRQQPLRSAHGHHSLGPGGRCGGGEDTVKLAAHIKSESVMNASWLERLHVVFALPDDYIAAGMMALYALLCAPAAASGQLTAATL